MEAPPLARAYVPLPVQASSGSPAISLFAAQGMTLPNANHQQQQQQQRQQHTGGGEQNVPIVRLKRKVDAELKTISVERSNKKALSEELAEIAVAEKRATAAAAVPQPPAAQPKSTPSPSPAQRQIIYRRVASYSARTFENLYGAEKLLERIYIKQEEIAQRESVRTAQRKRQDDQRERGKQQQLEAKRKIMMETKNQQQQPQQKPQIPITRSARPTQQEMEANEQVVIAKFMPLVHEYMKAQREQERKQALERDVEMRAVLDDYEVEIYEVAPSGTTLDVDLKVTLEPFVDQDLLVYDGELATEDDDHDSEDSNAEGNPNNDYGDDPDEEGDEDEDQYYRRNRRDDDEDYGYSDASDDDNMYRARGAPTHSDSD